MQEHDLQAIDVIEQQQAYCWSLKQLAESHNVDDGYVIVVDGVIAGFCFFSLTLDELSLFNVVIAADFRKQGLAETLLSRVISRYPDAARCFLEVRASNKAAIALYEKMDFICSGLRKRYYPCDSGREDALLFEKSITSFEQNNNDESVN
jgi:ribosomal-protein-alanine N-acetyltransferase